MNCEFSATILFVYIRDLSEISRGQGGGGGANEAKADPKTEMYFRTEEHTT